MQNQSFQSHSNVQTPRINKSSELNDSDANSSDSSPRYYGDDIESGIGNSNSSAVDNMIHQNPTNSTPGRKKNRQRQSMTKNGYERKRIDTRLARLSSIRASLSASSDASSVDFSCGSLGSLSAPSAAAFPLPSYTNAWMLDPIPSTPPSNVIVAMGNSHNNVHHAQEEDFIENIQQHGDEEGHEYDKPKIFQKISPHKLKHHVPLPVTLPNKENDNEKFDEDTSSIEMREEEHIIIAVIKLLYKRSWKKKLVTSTCITLIVLTIIDFIWFGNVQNLFSIFLEWMKVHVIAGSFACLGMFVLATIICIPSTILILGSGFIYTEAYGMGMGIYIATVSCFLGCCLGAVFAFVRARYMTRDLIKLFAKRYHIVNRLDSALKEKGFQVMLLLRLSSVVPFNVLNYIGGVTGIRIASFLLSLVGIIPQLVFTVVIGATAGNISEGKYSGGYDVWQKVLLCVGCLFGILALVAIWKLARLKLRDNEDDSIDTPMKMNRDTNTERTDSYDADGDEDDGGDWFWIWA
mmetsp:Transcript_2397/g.3756  ORF Transcript_2397/g.3756 Transcript_2397/m.3756 type:complete len:520 (+) Transcript_2397:49-1608(+)